ncbi:MAG: glycosyl hydrolase [Aliidiomarina sp.]|uniref:WD40/YVTN/BNR-like repeat-containing protein n=1 Tax=Aliidiomarina sp. TaxID=1872439 RepID=UPI0025BE89AA|nr:YCF48-related protein [Aliidiomarina sp.]MCH8500775.1 glycosyl hydrolase [Aliidiomarina sp.]
MLRKIGGVAAQIAPWAILGGLAYAAAFISPQIEPLELPQPLVESRDMFFDVAVTEDGQAWFVGGGGTVLRGDIDAASWQRMNVDDNNLQAIAVDDRGRMVIAGNGGWLYTSTNRGESWEQTQLPLSDFANKLTDVATDGQRFYVIGEMGAVYTSSNLVTWNSLSVDEDINLNSIFVDGEQIWIAAEFGTLLHSNDGGDSWRRHELGEESIRAISFNGSTGIAVGNQGFIAITRDQGDSWTALPTPGNEHLYDVIWQQQSEQARWVIVGDAGTLLTSTDGMNGWQSLRSAESGNQYFARAIAFGDYTLVAGRQLGKLSHDHHSDHASQWFSLPNTTQEMTP